MKISHLRKGITSILVTSITVFSIQVLLVLYDSFFNKKDVCSFLPWTGHWIWEILSIAFIYYIVKKMKIIIANLLLAIFVGMFLSSIIWILIPNTLKIKARYYGVESRFTTDTHSEGRYDENEVYDYPINRSFLYTADAPAIKKDYKKASKYNDYVNLKGFIFWQTGLAHGFMPSSIPQYDDKHTFLEHIWLFFSVGPTLLAECMIKGLYYDFLILIIAQIIWYVIRKQYYWWDEVK